MDDVGLGQAMGEHYREQMAKRALDECEKLRERVLVLERTLTVVINALVAHGIRGVSNGETSL